MTSDITLARETARIHADHASVKRLGHWTTADRVEVHARSGSAVLDLRSPRLPEGDFTVDLDLDRATVKLLVPDDAVVEYWDVRWTGRGRVKDGAGPRSGAGDGGTPEQSASDLIGAGVRRIRLTGSVRGGEVRVHRGGVAILSAMCSREYLAELRRAHRTNTLPTIDDPARIA